MEKEIDPRELNREFELKKMELDLAEQAQKPASVLSRIYKELKKLQYLIVTTSIQKKDLDPV